MASRASFSFSFGAAAIAACTVVWIACSGSSSSTTTTPNDGGGNGSSSGGSGSSSGSSGGSGSGSSSGSASGSGSGSGSGGTGDDSGSTGDDAGTNPPPVDSGLNQLCPAVPCPTGQTCCANTATAKPACQTSCDPADVIGCTGPSDCDSDGGECCATAVLENNADGAAFPACTIKTLTSFCGGKCTTAIGLTCTSTEKLHVCTSKADCATDTGNTECCAVDGYNICASTIDATFGKLTCMN